MRRSCSLRQVRLCCRKSLLHLHASCRRNNNRLCCRRSYSVCPTAFRLHRRSTAKHCFRRVFHTASDRRHFDCLEGIMPQSIIPSAVISNNSELIFHPNDYIGVYFMINSICFSFLNSSGYIHT